jgi:hypothetical protein
LPTLETLRQNNNKQNRLVVIFNDTPNKLLLVTNPSEIMVMQQYSKLMDGETSQVRSSYANQLNGVLLNRGSSFSLWYGK